MRASVKRQQELKLQRQQSSHQRTRLFVYGGLVLLGIVTILGVRHFEQRSAEAAAQSQARIEQQKKDEVELVKNVVARRLAREASERKVVADTIAQQVQSGAAVSVETGTCNFARRHNDPATIDVMVNKKHCLAPLGFAPSIVQVADVAIRPEAAPGYHSMLADAAVAGYALRTTSSYRSFETQVASYRHWLGVLGGNVVETNKVSALPGYSEHQTGLAVDIAAGECALHCLTSHPVYAWLKDHAHVYGFIERYPAGKESITGYDHESWHYRYVGVATATDMKKRNIQTLEEYWDML